MADQVVDSLVVTLGLDSAPFRDAQAQVQRAVSDTQRGVSTSLEDMGDSFLSLAGKITGIILGIVGLRDLVGIFKEAALNIRDSALSAEALGTTLRQIRQLSEQTQIMGGGPHDSEQWMNMMRTSVVGARLGEGFGGPLRSLAMLGINPMDPNTFGNPQGLLDRIGGALAARQTLPGGLPNTEPWRIDYLERELGMTQALAMSTLGVSPRGAEARATAATTNRGVTDAQGQAAFQLKEKLTDLKFQAENLAAQAFPALNTATAELMGAFKAFKKLLEDFMNGPIGATLRFLGHEAIGPLKWIGKETVDLTHQEWGPGGLVDQGAHGAVRAASAAGSWFNEVFGHTEQDLRLAAPRYGVEHAFSPSRFPAALSPLGLPPAAALIRGMAPSAAPGASKTSMTIGSIQVHTQATDADGIAGDIARAVRRKFHVTQADSGVVS